MNLTNDQISALLVCLYILLIIIGKGWAATKRANKIKDSGERVEEAIYEILKVIPVMLANIAVLVFFLLFHIYKK